MHVRFQQRMPFVIYSDCEALCTAHDEKRGESRFYSHQIACSLDQALVTKVCLLGREPHQSHTRPDVEGWFMRQMLDLKGHCIV